VGGPAKKNGQCQNQLVITATMSEQEKLEKRRQRRQQKIMAAAGDRLSRITGTAYRM
jgi:hypothetical protein